MKGVEGVKRWLGVEGDWMNILIISDIHNDVENLMNFIDKVALLNFDIIVCPGDFTDVSLPKGFGRTDITKLILEELNGLNKPILAVPGNQDEKIILLLEERGVSVHGRGKTINGIGFYGFGGAKTPFNTSFEPAEEEIKAGLEKAYEDVKDSNIKVQITHNPPVKTKLDMIPSGAHVGSEVVRKFIEEKQPVVAISAHIHEARGTDEIGKTKLINSGRFPEGYCGLVTIDGENATVKIVNLI